MGICVQYACACVIGYGALRTATSLTAGLAEADTEYTLRKLRNTEDRVQDLHVLALHFQKPPVRERGSGRWQWYQ